MARVGLSKPFYAEYTYGGTPAAISYSDGANFAKAVELSIEVDDTEPVRLYADNGVAESVSAFANGTLTLTVDDLTLAETAALLGLTTASSTTPAGTTLADLAENVPPMLGFGIVVKKIKNGTAKYLAIVLPKVQFNVPADAAVTQGAGCIEYVRGAVAAAQHRKSVIIQSGYKLSRREGIKLPALKLAAFTVSGTESLNYAFNPAYIVALGNNE